MFLNHSYIIHTYIFFYWINGNIWINQLCVARSVSMQTTTKIPPRLGLNNFISVQWLTVFFILEKISFDHFRIAGIYPFLRIPTNGAGYELCCFMIFSDLDRYPLPLSNVCQVSWQHFLPSRPEALRL